MIRAIVAGAAGRMGGRIIHMIRQSQDITLTAAFEHPDHPNVNEDAGLAAGIGKIGVNIAKSFQEVIDLGEVLMDFTTPESTLENLKLAASHDLSMVIGTTGFTGERLEEVTGLAKKIRCVMAPNMSVGVNVMLPGFEGETLAVDSLEILQGDQDSGGVVLRDDALLDQHNQPGPVRVHEGIEPVTLLFFEALSIPILHVECVMGHFDAF